MDIESPGVIPSDYPFFVQRLRERLGLTQEQLATRLGVSFATVNRWENKQAKPSPLSWVQIQKLGGDEPTLEPAAPPAGLPMDFTSPAEVVRSLVEGERLSFGHMFNPVFATEISQIDPLPHQRLAVYDHMLKESPLRFLLADDAGAGKTIMSGLYIREMKARRLLRRVLIVPPAGLVGNWQRELSTLFSLEFRIVSGADAKNSNPFTGNGSDCVIVSVDTLSGPKVFARLKEQIEPYDLVIFDEAHKLSADRDRDLSVRKTDRYRLAEALAGVGGLKPEWTLPWTAHHLLLLTATPHQGKEYPYYALWRLLEPEVLSTLEAFTDYPADCRAIHFIRRTKEEMVQLSGKPLYPKRMSDTLGYDLTQGDVSEQRLYDETTDYMRYVYNRAKMLNRSAARLAMSVLQRRLASSTFALLRSFERRIDKLDELISQVIEGRLTMEQLVTLQRRLADEDDVLDSKTADDESSQDGQEENEQSEDKLMAGVIAASLGDLVAEREQVVLLRELARKVNSPESESSKFERLREILTDPKFTGEKFIVFTEHRDTLHFLVQRLSGLGYTGQIAQIHGGMHYTERQEQVERFRLPSDAGGARFMLCTDAAAEGINLQFCWIMINYDVPWNPARLEQRMGRIHRYGQKHDPVVILNLVAPKTREGLVLKVLLDKLEAIRKELKSDKVFDSIGRIFEGVSIKQYMEQAIVEGPENVAKMLEGKLTKEQVEALEAKQKILFGTGGDVARQLPRLREDLAKETFCRLLPGYTRNFVENAAPLVGIQITGDLDGCFSFRSAVSGGVDPLLHTLELYTAKQRNCLTFARPDKFSDAIWVHPGEPVFERFRTIVADRLGDQALRGAVFVDPTTDKPYLFHLALVSVVRQVDAELPDFAEEDVLECRLIGVKQFDGAGLTVCPVEHLLLLKAGHGLPPGAQRLAMTGETLKTQAVAFLIERVARAMAVERRNGLLTSLPEREQFLQRGFDFQEAELAAARLNLTEKARSGHPPSVRALDEIKAQQRSLAARKAKALAILHREPELIAPGAITFVAHALIVPSTDPDALEQHDAEVERVAMHFVRAYEEAAGGVVQDVHTPALARAAGLSDNPGFDVLSTRPGDERRAIEVKGRGGTGDVEVSANEWAAACNIRTGYWLYAVYECATPLPRLARVQDPFGSLLAKSKGSVLIGMKEISQAAEASND